MKRIARGAALVVAVMAVAAGLLAASGQPPAPALWALWTGGFGSADALAGTVARATPLLLTGTAVAVALAAGLLNIGAEGQMAVGALAAAVVASAAWLPTPLVLPCALLAAAIVGGLWGSIPAVLRERCGAHEVITALLLNTIARNLTHYAASGPWRDPTGGSPQTRLVHATLPRLLDGQEIHAGLVLAAVATAAAALWLKSTPSGYEARVVGVAPDAARRAGIRDGAVRIRAFLLSGALAGLAGGVVILGETPFRRFPADFFGIGYGFDGLAVALLAGGSVWGVFPAALVFGGLAHGAEAMSFEVGAPRQIAQVIQSLILLGIASRWIRRERAR